MNYSKSAPGFGLIMIVVAVVVILAIGGGVYAYMVRNGQAPSIVPGLGAGSVVSLNANCNYKDSDLCKFINNWPKQTNYTVTATSENPTPDAKSSVAIIKIDGTDKTQFTTTTDNKESMSMITIADTTYTKDESDGKWVKTTTTAEDKSVKSNYTYQASSSADLDTPDTTTYTKVGKEACGKLTCFKYTVTTKGQSADGAGTQTIWFDDSQYLLRKIEVTSADVGKSTMDYNYDKVTITAPSPIKAAATPSTGTSLNPNGTGLTQEQLNQLELQAQQRAGTDFSAQ